MNAERILAAMQEFNDSDMQITTWPKCVIVHNDSCSVMVKITPLCNKIEATCEAIERLKFAAKGVAMCTIDASNVEVAQ